ncbi:hypothetical protein [Salisaeta longa]|uniref:hypothetical protein n=1 Tax=Salisaeta longa TaxID=503170 RepID=UPI00041A0B4E|nr:hypothetical protein [Salisaeta longa]
MIALVLAVSLTFADSVQANYAQQDVAALRSLLQQADTRMHRLLCRYRLYPLTEEGDIIEDIPEDLPNGSARELALLSGLWAYRAGEASFFGAIRYGRRSQDLLEKARARDPNDPYVLLVAGQSLMFRPAIAGRDLEAAAQHFQRLVDVVHAHTSAGIAMAEAKTWLWMAYRALEWTGKADRLRAELLAGGLPSLYTQFLNDPPRI